MLEINTEIYLKKREYRRNRYHNMSEEKKQKLKPCNQKIKKIILTFFLFIV